MYEKKSFKDYSIRVFYISDDYNCSCFLINIYILKGKRKATKKELDKLKDLGFIAHEDLAYVYHPGINQEFDLTASDIDKIILIVFNKGVESGRKKLQEDFNKLLTT